MPSHGGFFESAGFTKHLAVLTSVLILIGMFVAYFALDPSALSDGTFVSLANSALPLVMAATAETVVLIGGGIDLSVGVVISLVSVIVATTMQGSVGSMLLWSLVAVVVGCTVGLVNAILIEYLHISAFIATLATLEVVQGLALGVLGSPGGTIPPRFTSTVLGTSFHYVPNSMLDYRRHPCHLRDRQACPGISVDLRRGRGPPGSPGQRHPGPAGGDGFLCSLRRHRGAGRALLCRLAQLRRPHRGGKLPVAGDRRRGHRRDLGLRGQGRRTRECRRGLHFDRAGERFVRRHTSPPFTRRSSPAWPQCSSWVSA